MARRRLSLHRISECYDVEVVRLSEGVRAALRDLRGRLEERFGARLAGMIVFGSYARGEAGPDSDVDVMVLVNDLTHADRREVYDLGAEVWMDTRVRLAPLALSPAELDALRRRERLLALDLATEGIPV